MSKDVPSNCNHSIANKLNNDHHFSLCEKRNDFITPRNHGKIFFFIKYNLKIYNRVSCIIALLNRIQNNKIDKGTRQVEKKTFFLHE